MGEKCCACQQEFREGETSVAFFFQAAKRGEKSGMVGLYEHPDYPNATKDYVHFTHTCLEKCFSPVDNPFLYDVLTAAMRKEVVDDVREEVYEEMREEYEFGEGIVPFEEDPPMCIWCKKVDYLWCHFRMGGTIYNCMSCRKMWDDEETELTWDPDEGYVEVRDD